MRRSAQQSHGPWFCSAVSLQTIKGPVDDPHRRDPSAEVQARGSRGKGTVIIRGSGIEWHWIQQRPGPGCATWRRGYVRRCAESPSQPGTASWHTPEGRKEHGHKTNLYSSSTREQKSKSYRKTQLKVIILK